MRGETRSAEDMTHRLHFSRVGFDNSSFHPDDGEPTVYDGNSRSIAFPTTEPLRTIRITSNERVASVSVAASDRDLFFSTTVIVR